MEKTELTNQKEYLKKYLSGGDKKKKKRKKPIIGDRVKIIDDDIDISQLQTPDEAIELFNTNEDAPQVVGVIDDRPMHLRIKDYADSNLWKPVGDQQPSSTIIENALKKTFFEIKSKDDNLLQFKQFSLQKDKKLSTGRSVNKKNKVSRTDNSSINRDVYENYDNSPRKNTSADSSPLIRQPEDSSPPRKTTLDVSLQRQGVKRSDRGSKFEQDIDSRSPITRNDSSPPRRNKKICSPQMDDNSPPRKKQSSSDNSPPRRHRKISDSSLPRRSKSENTYDSRSSIAKTDYSPARREDPDSSPPRKKNHFQVNEGNRKILPGDKRGKYLIPAKRTDKLTKTLDGKTAGLQNAQELVKETQNFRQREDNLFKTMDANVSGVNASTIVRDRKTGKIRDFAKEAEELKEKQRKEDETKEKYMRWGKGLKQTENYEDKLSQDLVEMNKPLARYADDEDLERFLKEREREEDPMLQYIRRKRKKKDVEVGKPTKPQYMGEFMPNRYGIIPGHRWDGVDRSNGYEKKWVEAQNAKQAIQEDIYKWSTEDM